MKGIKGGYLSAASLESQGPQGVFILGFRFIPVVLPVRVIGEKDKRRISLARFARVAEVAGGTYLLFVFPLLIAYPVAG